MSFFDMSIKREGTHCVKWDDRESVFTTKDVLPMSIADMDFLCPSCIVEAIKKRALHGEYGYNSHKEVVDAALIEWMKKRHDYLLSGEEIFHLPGVVMGIVLSILAFTKEGDKVLIQPPVYPPFFAAVQKGHRQLVENHLIQDESGFRMDVADLEQKLQDPKVKLMVLCSPHNPVGRVWTKEELHIVHSLCLAHDVRLVVDEIHGDIIYSGHRHVVFGSLSEEARNNCVILTSAGKYFNISGLNLGFAMISNPDMRNAFFEKMEMMHLGRANIMGAVATEAGYLYGAPYLEELLVYLEGNRDYLVQEIKSIPGVSMATPEGTYLGWLNFGDAFSTENELLTFLVKSAKLGLNNGSPYGAAGNSFARINFALSRECLEEAVRRLREAMMKRG